MFFTWGNTVKMLGISCFNAAGQFLPLVLIFKGVNKRQEIGDGLIPVLGCALTEYVVCEPRRIQQVVHRAIPQTQHFGEGNSRFRWTQSSLNAAPLYSFRLLLKIMYYHLSSLPLYSQLTA